MKTSVFILLSGAVLAAGLAFGGPKAWIGGESGDWNVPTNWDPVGLPDSSDDVMVVDADVTLTGPIDVNALTVVGAAKLTVKAIGLEGDDLAVFSTLETDLAPIAAKLWEKATVVNVRNDFTVDDGATVYPEADKVSGVPVIFKVGGDFTLGEGSSFNAVNRGWGWTLGTTDLAGAKTNPGGTAAWTFAPGAGRAYNYGGGYGGNASCPNVNGGRNYGYSYGCSFAPFLPGSCSGVYTQTSAATVDGTRGGGAIVIFTEGEATIDGTMTAMSERHDYSSASGGSIWLTAKSFTFGTSARLTAKAADSQNYQWQGVGGGGRIALAEGYTWDDMATAAGGTVPTGFIEQPTIWPEIVDADVSKAACNDKTKNYEPNPGTLSYVRQADKPVQMRVTLDGAGSVTYDGTTYDESFVVDVPVNEALALTAAVADGNVFGAWYGDGLAVDGVANQELSYTASLPFKLRVVFKSLTATSRAWTGAVSADWNTGANWNPAGVPGPNDSVSVSGGTTRLGVSTELNALTLDNGAALTVGDSTVRNDATLDIAGDLNVLGGSTLTVFAGTLTNLSVFATLETDIAPLTNALWNAAKIVTVGGNLTVTGAGSTVYPDADKVTGVPVFFKVGGDFTLGEGASFNAVRRGWGWTAGTTTLAGAKKNTGAAAAAGWSLAPGSGRDYYVGGGYGGNAAYVQVNAGAKFGYAYGNALAPFLPGSNSGWYNQSQFFMDNTRGGGAVVVFTEGNATIDGTVDVSSEYKDHSGASGGGIWLTAAKFTFGDNALLNAKGANISGYYGQGLGGGGRIALAEGYSWADIETAVGGSVPDGFRDAGTILASEVATDVAGGTFTGTGQKYYSNPGTLSFVRSAALPVSMLVMLDGEGSVTYDGVTHTETFEVMVPTKTDITFTATPSDGWRFISWGGVCIPGSVATTPELVFAVYEPGEIMVSFANGEVTRRWVGGETGEWNQPLNWRPVGMPGIGDNVTLSNVTITATGAITAGSLTLAGTAKLVNAAEPIEGECTPAALFAGATVVRIQGALRLEDAARLVPANDPVTGAPVRYEVGSLYVAEGAGIDASAKGWKWYESADDPYATLTQDKYQTRAPGAGGDDKAAVAYNRGGGYGAAGGNSNGKYGCAYGFKYAPFLPGSPNGLYNWSVDNMGLPGGTVWIKSAGLMEIDGTITSVGQARQFGAPSGGGIWLIAPGLAAGQHASISAMGGELTGSNYDSYGAGGRVSIALGITDEQMAALAAGETPDGLEYADAIDLIPVEIRGGPRNSPSGTTYGPAGTATTVLGPNAFVPVQVLSNGPLAMGVAPNYGSHSYAGGTEQTFTAPEYGIDPDDPSVRYACAGYVVSNALGEVTHGAGTTVDVAMENGPLTLTWKWGAAQSRTVIRKPANGTLTFDGVAVDGDGIIWATGLSPAIAVVPDSGYEFVGWEGNVPYGKTWANPLQVTVTEPLDLIPVLRAVAGPTTRTWNGTGDWTDAAKWDPAGLPGADDAVVIAGGKCVVSNGLRAAALTVADGATLAIAAAGAPNGALAVAGNVSVAGTLTVGYGVVATGSGDNLRMVGARMPGHVRVAVGGDFTLTGSGRVEVYGGPVGGDFTFASGCGFVEVGGTLALQDTSVLALYSDIYTGGSVKITTGGFMVAAGATVDAASKGYAWADGTTPPDAPGLGYSYTIAASHGGWGCQPTGQNSNKTKAPYDFELAPTMPGSPNGTYAGGQRPGGGVIRVHAKTVSIDGTLDAGVFHYTNYGGAAGGSIWLTADAFAFGANARLIANGGRAKAQYATYGAGGRIAIGYRIGDARLAALAETGTWPGFKAKRQKTLEEFRATVGNATMTVDVEMGGYVDANPSDGERATYERILEEGYPRGTFTFVNDYNPRTLLFVK